MPTLADGPSAADARCRGRNAPIRMTQPARPRLNFEAGAQRRRGVREPRPRTSWKHLDQRRGSEHGIDAARGRQVPRAVVEGMRGAVRALRIPREDRRAWRSGPRWPPVRTPARARCCAPSRASRAQSVHLVGQRPHGARDVDDPPRRRALQQREEALRDRDRAEHVRVERPPEHVEVDRAVVGGLGRLGQDAGVVDQHVEPAVALADVAGRVGDAGGRGDVEDDHLGVDAVVAQILHGALAGRRRTRADDDRVAVPPAEPASGLQAQTPACAGHECDFRHRCTFNSRAPGAGAFCSTRRGACCEAAASSVRLATPSFA